MKRKLSVLIILGILALNLTGISLTAKGAELTLEDLSKTADGYYIIDSVDAYKLIGSNLSQKFVIWEHLDLTELGNSAVIGSGSSPFSGEIIGRLNGNSAEKTVLTLDVNLSNGSNLGLISVLDGADAKVQNLVVKGGVAGLQHVGGLVGWIKNGAVEDCENYATVEATYNTSNTTGVRIGGIAGIINTKGVLISGCVNGGTIVHQNKCTGIGGIVGLVVTGGSGETSQITTSLNKGNIKTNGYRVGGILGYCYAGTTVQISLCKNIGNIELTTDGTGTGGGGIVGYLAGSITKCFNTGNITGLNLIGGIAGQSSNEAITYEISNCYNTGAVTALATGTTSVSGITYTLGGASATKSILKYNYSTGSCIGNSTARPPVYYQLLGSEQEGIYNYHLSDLTSFNVSNGDKPVALTAAEMQNLKSFQNEADPNAFSGAVWQIAENDLYGYAFPQLIGNPHKEAKSHEYIPEQNHYILTWTTREIPTYYLRINDGVTSDKTDTTQTNQYLLEDFDGQSVYTIRIYSDQAYENLIEEIVINTKYGGGCGTAMYPYMITTLTQLQNVTGAEYFKQTRDITEELITPISDFTGVYNGNKKSVALKINLPSTTNVGMFGDVAGSTIRNVVTKGSVVGKNNVGAVVGYSGALVENCINYASVSAESGAGGIAGATRTNAKVLNCANLGNITAKNTAAGVVGYTYGTVSNSYNAGNVKVEEYGAGITANTRFDACVISNSYNSGKIEGNKTAGIAISQHNDVTKVTVTNCYNIGDAVYAIALHANYNPVYEITGSYYFLGNGVDNTTYAQEVVPTAFTATDIGTAFYSDAGNISYIYPQISGNPHIGEHIVQTLTITANSGGEVQKAGIRYLKRGETYSINITPSANYVIKDVLWQGNSVSAFDIDGTVYLTPSIEEDSTLQVIFEEDTRLPGIVNPGNVFSGSLSSEQLIGKITEDELESIAGKAAGLAFFTISDYPVKYVISDYGIVLSKNNPNPEINGNDCKTASVKDKFQTLNKKIGVLFYGKYITDETDYYVRAYLIYHDGIKEMEEYGTPYKLTASEVQEILPE